MFQIPTRRWRPGTRRTRTRALPLTLAAVLLAWLLPAAAPASDGAIEISPEAAALGGVTPGDPAGLPVLITTPGRFVLTGDLAVPDSATTAIEVLADGVSIDLNGFTISGPPLCSGDPVACSPAGIGLGISSTGSDTTVFDGSITGMGSAGLQLGLMARVEDVAVSLNAGAGVVAGAGSEIRESRIERNGGAGIDAGAGSLVIDNVVRGNLGVGLQLASDGGYANNVFSGNLPPDIVGGVELGTNACPASGGCPASQVDCGGLCVDTDTDEANCGACGNTCNAGEFCSFGTCSLSCPTGQTNCGGFCVDTQSDEQNCGSCSFSCSPGFRCSSGSCQLSCQTGLVNCGGVCTDTDSDESHCGGCNNACNAGQLCVFASCTAP